MSTGRMKWQSLVLVLMVLGVVAWYEWPTLLRFREDAAFFIHPSAGLAFQYAEAHFDAEDPNKYDLARAEFFYKKAAALDPSVPYLNHELARISFLKGHYRTALSQINFEISQYGDSEPNSYYVRGLIEGYMGNYSASKADYAYFLTFDPNDWAAMNDYAWVLLKAHDYEAAAAVTTHGLSLYPVNPWLLNSHAIALFEIGSTTEALKSAALAVGAARNITAADWLHAYPGNDPAVAGSGIESLQSATIHNMEHIQAAVASSTIE